MVVLTKYKHIFIKLKPYDCSVKDIKKFFEKKFYFPFPNFGKYFLNFIKKERENYYLNILFNNSYCNYLKKNRK